MMSRAWRAGFVTWRAAGSFWPGMAFSPVWRSLSAASPAPPDTASRPPDDGGEPDLQAVELGEKYAWSYVARRGGFYIYRTFEPGARELNTDPLVQALALESVKKRQAGSVLSILFWLIVYPLLMLRGGLFLTMINVKTWFFLLGALLAVWMFADSLAAFLSLRRLQKKLRSGGWETADSRPKRAGRYHAKNALQLALIVLFAALLLRGWSVDVMNGDKIPLEDYADGFPFATLRDFAGPDGVGYRMTMRGMSLNFNCVKEWSDLLAPRNFDYGEHAQITGADGSVLLDGGLYVDYHEAASPWLARRLAHEYRRIDSREKGFELIGPLDLGADYAAAYYTGLHFPTVVIQDGCVVVHVLFYQSGGSSLALEQWAQLVADSIMG